VIVEGVENAVRSSVRRVEQQKKKKKKKKKLGLVLGLQQRAHDLGRFLD